MSNLPCKAMAHSHKLLFGQKVSRLGLSTHMEKVSAILNLDIPRNVHDLQIFLGMMVYFSSYIPFYAWIAVPLFGLLRKETKWEWTNLPTWFPFSVVRIEARLSRRRKGCMKKSIPSFPEISVNHEHFSVCPDLGWLKPSPYE